ncbi:MAG: hypothetical protein WAO02_06905 [Verrucomicrobiia bacterium]
MILEMTATALITIGAPVTQGASDAARFVASQAEQGRRHLQSSYTFGLQSRGIFDELFAAAETARESGWDGYGAAPVSPEAYAHAYRFVESLPLGTPPPTVTAESDGHLAFEWYAAPHRTLSVSVSPEGDLHYSALLGPNKVYGTEVFFGETPRAILDLIRRVQSA